MKVDNLGYYENSLVLVNFVFYFEYMGWNNMDFYFVVELYYYFVCIPVFDVAYFYKHLDSYNAYNLEDQSTDN